jgi:2-haloacid dehalogenase
MVVRPRVPQSFVSSNCWDVVGAKAYGFPVAWVNRLGAPLEELGVAPDLEVADLAELARALGR